MSDSNDNTGGTPYGGPPPAQNPYGQPPAGQQPSYGQPPAGQQPPYGQTPYGEPGYGPGHGAVADPHKRPGTVTAAAVVTLVTAGLTALLFAIVVVGLLVAKDQFLDEMESQQEFQDTGISADSAFGAILGFVGVFALWSIIACVLAVMVLRRSNVARITLVVSSVVAALLSLAAIGSLVSAFTLIAAVAVIVCLFAGGAGDWFKAKNQQPTSQGTPQY